MRWIPLFALLALGACGTDGEPIKPTGSASISVGTGGVSTSATLGATAGPVTVSVGF
ncbi:MAG: hypothetical protein AAFR53_13670 [Pseudomonadota bacterium]